MDLKFALFAMFAFILASCASPVAPTTAPNSGAPVALENTQWRLVSFGAREEQTPVLPETDVTLQFGTGGVVSGTGGCNSFGGKYTLENNMLALTEVNSTLRACLDETANQQEQRYLQALQSTGRVEQNGDRLTIEYDDGNSILTFNRATASAPPSQVWQASGGIWNVSHSES
jgi:heat shock protein HslJ